MKGIRKLFLGLIFLTLFGVGFKVEAKAVTSVKLTQTGTTLLATATFEEADFSDEDTTLYLGIKSTNCDVVKPSYKITLSVDDEKKIISYVDWNGDEIEFEFSSDNNKVVFPLSRERFYPLVDGQTTKSISVQAVLAEDDELEESVKIDPANGKTVAYKYTVCARSQTQSYNEDKGFSYAPINPYYSSAVNGVDFKVDGWPDDPNSSPEGITTIQDGGSVFLLIGDTRNLSATDPTDSRFFHRGWGQFKNETEQNTEKQSNTPGFELQGATSSGSRIVIAEYTKISQYYESAVDVYIGNQHSLKPIIDESLADPRIGQISYVLEPQNGDVDHYLATQQGTAVVITGVSETGGYLPTPLKVTTTYGTDDRAVEFAPFPVKIRVLDSSPIESGDVFVNLGLDVYLDDYIYADDSGQTVIVKDRSGLVSITPKSATSSGAKLENILIHGAKSGYSEATEKKGGLVVSLAEEPCDVTVYPNPTLTKTNSSSSSSTSSDAYKLTITMPKGVHYATSATSNVRVDDLTQTYLEYESMASDGKIGYEIFTLDSSSSSSSSTLTKKKEVNESRKELTKDLREICRGDSDTVKIRAYAYHDGKKDSKIVTNEETIKVYKIKLDDGGKANYTVDGESVSDYFYGVDGVTYTIKASPKVSGDKLLNWDDNVFSSTSDGGSYTVRGSKTLKANYSSSSSSSSFFSSSSSKGGTGGSGGSGSDSDYDDVPKTGESKADIWILWSVLFVSIIGAGFMIYKRFGLARAIAETDREMEAAVIREEKAAKKKEKDDKLKMLKDLRNL